MENLNAETVKKALECCLANDICDSKCGECQYKSTGADCMDCMLRDALALINSQEQRIKELTEENERLKLDVEVCGAELSRYTENIVQMAKQDRADTVRKMQERLKAETITIQDHTGKLGLVVLVGTIDQIAKEMEEGENNG